DPPGSLSQALQLYFNNAETTVVIFRENHPGCSGFGLRRSFTDAPGSNRHPGTSFLAAGSRRHIWI
ncbi:hypothetical protein, partial [Salmonella enterica]|uniref:hypothetical protein n=1 Tax=Salmonella enterica TaxID=28901 RepID=UPI003CEC86DE